MGIFANSEDLNEMPHNAAFHNAAFHQGLHCLLRQHRSVEKKYNIFLKIIACDPSTYTMGHPDLTVSNFMGNSIGLKRVNNAFSELSGLITKFTTKKIRQTG